MVVGRRQSVHLPLGKGLLRAGDGARGGVCLGAGSPSLNPSFFICDTGLLSRLIVRMGRGPGRSRLPPPTGTPTTRWALEGRLCASFLHRLAAPGGWRGA